MHELPLQARGKTCAPCALSAAGTTTTCPLFVSKRPGAADWEHQRVDNGGDHVHFFYQLAISSANKKLCVSEKCLIAPVFLQLINRNIKWGVEIETIHETSIQVG